MIGAAIKAQLVVSTATAAYLAAAPDPDRVYPLVIPQKVPRGAEQVPAVVYTITAIERQQLYCGTSGIIRTRVSLDCYATSYEEAKALGDAVRHVLQDFRGMLGAIVDVRQTELETEIELQDIEPGLFRVSQSWAFWHVE